MFDKQNKKATVPSNLPISEESVPASPEDNLDVTPEQTPSQEKDTVDKVYAEQEQKKEKGLDDIFSDTQNKEKPEVFQATDSDHHDDWGISEAELKEQNKKKLTMLLLIFVVIILLGGGSYWVFTRVIGMIGSDSAGTEEGSEPEPYQEPGLETTGRQNEKQDEDAEEEGNANENQVFEENQDQGFIDEGDNDRDGLSNQEELELGTNLNKVDTDDDTLFDREEVKVYRTNPLNPDTDGDGFLDGEEVKAGYNPKGEGRLNVIK